MFKFMILSILLSFCFIYASSKSVLILEDGGTEDSVLSILTTNGISATLGGKYWEYTASGIDQHDVIIILNGISYNSNIPDTVQHKIRLFVANGGTLLTTEWLAYYSSYYPILASMLPIVYNNGYSTESEVYRKTVDHPISQLLPDSFITPSVWSYSLTKRDTASAKQAVTLFTGSKSGDAVVAGKFSKGRVVHWNMAGQYSGDSIWTTQTRQLLLNIVNYLRTPIAVEKNTAALTKTCFMANYPNPFNPHTSIQYHLYRDSHVYLKVYDQAGHEVTTIINKKQSKGSYLTKFNATGLAGGVYYFKLIAGDEESVKKMIYLR